MVACTTNYVLRAVIDTKSPPFSNDHLAYLLGVTTGFSGSLSTVSTWVVEVGRRGTNPAQTRGLWGFSRVPGWPTLTREA
jgi:fluoride ion exporter CrcB/FEX